MNSKAKTNLMHMLLLVAVLAITLIPNGRADTSLNPFDERKIFEPTIKEDMSDFIKEDFNPDYGVIRLSKTFFWFETDKIAEYSLIDNTEQCLIDCSAIGKASLYYEGQLFEDINFKDKLGKFTDIDAKFFILITEKYEIEVPDTYEEKVCVDRGLEGKVCTQEPATYKKETRTREVWQEYNGEVLKAGDYTWLLKGKKGISQSVDWVAQSQGKSLDAWAWWDNS